MVGVACLGQPGPSLAAPGQVGRGPCARRQCLQLVHRGLRDRRSQGGPRLLEELEIGRDRPAPPRVHRRPAVANLSSDPEQEYFSDGLTEEVIADLSKVRALRCDLAHLRDEVQEHGQRRARDRAELNVRHVLEGSVRKSGHNLCITAQLIDAATDAHLWRKSTAARWTTCSTCRRRSRGRSSPRCRWRSRPMRTGGWPSGRCRAARPSTPI